MAGLPARLLGFHVGSGLAGEDVREPLDVGAGDDGLALLVLLAEPVDELGPEDVDLAVQDAPPVRDLLLLLRVTPDEVLQLLVAQRAEVREAVHREVFFGHLHTPGVVGDGEYSLNYWLRVGVSWQPSEPARRERCIGANERKEQQWAASRL